MKSRNILRVINNLKKAIPMARNKCQLDMKEAYVNTNGHVCGTTHCHGGWYAVVTCDLTKCVDYTHGAHKMGRALGFKDSDVRDSQEALESWAEKNPELWGNKKGGHMFYDHLAFRDPLKRPRGAQNLQHIIDHWQGVYERVKALELKKEEV